MAQPSSSHHRERERERERSSHHHHRTISSTTLLLVLSLILAVLAVMLSLPSQQAGGDGSTSGVWGYLSPKRSQALVAREHAVAIREAEVARREADLLAGSSGSVTPISCPPFPSQSLPASSSPQVYVEPPIQTIIKEVVKEVEALGPPSWWKDAGVRVEDLLDRESRISEREKDVGRREEQLGRRESDASRRETWIMEQLIALGNEPAQTVEEEIIYDSGSAKRKPKELPPLISITETKIKTVTHNVPPVTQIEIHTETETVTVPPAAHTRNAARPAPEAHIRTGPALSNVRPTTAVEVVKEDKSLPTPEIVSEVVEEVIREEEFEDDFRGRTERTVTIVQRPKQTRRPTKWFGGRW